MRVARYYTMGAVACDLRALVELHERLDGAAPDYLVVLVRRRDERLVKAALPGARTLRVESGLSRMQWVEFASAFLGVVSVSVLLGAVHLATGLVVQAVMTLAAAVGLLIYHRRPRVQRKLLAMGIPGDLATSWEKAFADGFALALAVVPADALDGAREAYDGPGLRTPLALDRRPVL
jgi:hypothetical protein